MARLLVIFIVLPAALGLERLAYYAMRSALVWHLVDELGVSSREVGTLLTSAYLLPLGLFVLGAVACAVLRPSIVLAAGVALSAAGHLVLVLSSDMAGVWLGLIVLGVGQGLGKPAFFALAARELGFPREMLRAALFALLYLAINVGALLGGSSGVASATGGATLGLGLAFGASLVALLLALGLVAADFMLRAEARAEPRPRTGGVIAGAGLLLLAVLPAIAMFDVSSQLAMRSAASWVAPGTLFAINPIVVSLTAAVLFVVFLVLHFTAKRPSPLFGVGAGLCVVAAAATPLLLDASSPAVLGLALAGMAFGEALAMPLAMSRAFGDVPARATGAVVAGWLLLTGGMGMIVNAVGARWPGGITLVLALATGASLLLGVALLVGTPLVVKRLYTPPEAEQAPA